MRKDITGYEGIYQINEQCIIKSLDRIEECKNVLTGGTHRKRKGRILKTSPDSDGYLQVTLQKNRKLKRISIHRLLAQAFIPNPNNLPQVNHKDGVKTNNKIDNLEWCTISHNVKHAYNNGFIKFPKNGDHHFARPIKQLSLDGELIKEWRCIIDAQNELGTPRGAIGHCCMGLLDNVGGYKWQYATPT